MNPFVDQITANYTPLSDEAQADLIKHLRTKVYAKGDVINSQGEIYRQLNFIVKGLAKHYYYHNERYFVIRFFSENNFFTVLDSFIQQTPAEFATVALEDTELLYLTYDDVQLLAKRHHSFETFLRILFSSAAIHNLHRIQDIFNNDAKALYEGFTKDNKHLLQRISLGDIAGYLGISQVSLSRIRSKR